MKRWLLLLPALAAATVIALLAWLAPGQAGAQTAPGVRTFPIVGSYDVPGLTYTYVLWDPNRSGTARITTAGSNVVTTAVSGTPFAGLGVGDELAVRINEAVTIRYIATWTSATQVSVDTAWDLTAGYAFSYRRLQSGTGAGVGWFKVSDLSTRTVMAVVTQYNGTGGIDVSVEGRGPSGVPFQIATGNIAGATFPNNEYVVDVPGGTVPGGGVQWLRVGLKITTTDTGVQKAWVDFSGRP